MGLFLIFSVSANADWNTYENDLRNSASPDGIGYFPLKTANFSNELYGMDFQPLVDDINKDGYNEIVIFSNDFLKIFDYELNLIDEKFVGMLLGQPTIFNNKIVFNSKINDKNYFFAYQLNNLNLQQVFNITLSNDADFGGIKCLNLNGANICVFKDKINYVHIVNLTSKNDSAYLIPFNNNETHQTIPAIWDLDSDGNLDAVFWIRSNDSSNYGIFAFDLAAKSVKWTVNTVFSAFLTSYILKGQPVLVDLNNDGKLEVAVSVYYDDSFNQDSRLDKFTELSVYNHNGTKLFSKCEVNPSLNAGCNSGNYPGRQFEGTNPFVLDYDKNGFDDICFLKTIDFSNMGMNCYNYSGDQIAKVKLTAALDGVKETAMVADMNDDGNKEIITSSRIYLLNGTSIFDYNLGKYHPIAVDLDGNNGLDLLWTKDGQIKTFLDDTGAIKVSGVLIEPENPSVDDSLSCSWRIIGNNKVISANVSWYRNGEFYGNEIVTCINNTLCTTINNIPSSALNEDDVWKCSVAAFESNKKSLPKSDTILVLSKSSEWPGFSKNQISYGISSGNGYFSKSAASTIIYNSSGTNFQPMVTDIDNNGENEIIMFSNNSLIILNKSLAVIAQRQVGNLRGQFDIANMDNDAYLEIIGVVNSSNQDNFMIFAFNGSDFKIKTSFNVSSQNGYQDIRCLDFDRDNKIECVFRDFNGIVHSYQINATNANDDELNVNISDKEDNVYESKVNIVPSFVDFDRDNDLDGLFWFNDNFAVVDSNKNIILNVDVGTLSALFQNPALLGIKFVNLDKAGNYEIAAAYRHDYIKAVAYKTDINLTLFDSRGKIIFSKVIDFYNVNPCLNDGKRCLGFGSDLFVTDYNKDGFDDIGIYLEGTDDSPYGAFIKFFDRNGNQIASNKVEFVEGSSIPQAVTLADMDNDNNVELILRRRIYNLDGTALYNFSDPAMKVPIAVDVDKNQALDLLWFNSNQLILLLDNNTRRPDLSIEEKDISFRPLNGTSVLVTANVRNNGGLNLDNVKVKLTNSEALDEAKGVISIKGNSNNNLTAILNLRSHEIVHAQVNYDDSIKEERDNNNFASKEFMGLPYVFVSADLEPSNIESEFKEYIKSNLVSGYYAENENEADVLVYIGKNNPRNMDMNVNFMNQYDIGYDYGNINYNDKVYSNSFNGLVAAFKEDNQFGKNHVNVMIVGNEIEGDIAATKEFIRNQVTFLNTKTFDSFAVDDDNSDAVKVWDYMHSETNKGYYGSATEQFKDIVGHSLNDTMVSETNLNITTYNNFTLRLRNLKPILSNDYLAYLNSSNDISLPVVMSGGIWSDISSWQDLGNELANSGRDIWLIEITGGPSIECDNCVNYNYSDLINEFWPASIGSVEKLTGRNQIQYVGHSNGCRAALDSLSSWQSTGKSSLGKVIYNGSEILIDMSSNPVDTFVGVACPGSFSELSYFAKQVNKSGGIAIQRLRNNNLHPKFGDVAHELESVSGEVAGVSRFFDNPRLSLNLFQQYYDWIHSDKDEQPGDVDVDYFTIITGTKGFFTNGKDDTIVPTKDELFIFNKLTSNNKVNVSVSTIHIGMPKNNEVKRYVKQSLDKTIY